MMNLWMCLSNLILESHLIKMLSMIICQLILFVVESNWVLFLIFRSAFASNMLSIILSNFAFFLFFIGCSNIDIWLNSLSVKLSSLTPINLIGWLLYIPSNNSFAAQYISWVLEVGLFNFFWWEYFRNSLVLSCMPIVYAFKLYFLILLFLLAPLFLF